MGKKTIITCDGCGVVIEEPKCRADPAPMVMYVGYGEANHDPSNPSAITEWDSLVFHSPECFKKYDFSGLLKEMQKEMEKIEAEK